MPDHIVVKRTPKSPSVHIVQVRPPQRCRGEVADVSFTLGSAR